MSLAVLSPGCADALLFDLGRVVLDIDFKRTLAHWAEHAGVDTNDIVARFSVTEAYRQHERGEIDDAAFFASLRETLGLSLSDQQFLAGWNATFVGEMPGIANHLERAGRSLPLYAFSNTNPAHIAHFWDHHAEVLRPFKKLFLSSSIGMRKPDAAAFDHVVKEIGVPASRIIFFDDSIDNVEGAESRGLIGVHVETMDDVDRALLQLGL